MAQTYTVKVVDQDEWAQIVQSTKRYEHVDDTNLGFADPQHRVAYAHRDRLKSFPGLKEYVLQHEFEHLMSDEKLHEDEHGVRHKKFFKQVALPILGGLGGTLLAGPLGTALGAGAGGLSGLGTGLLTAGLGGAGTAAGSALGGASGSQAVKAGLTGSALSGVGQLAASRFLPAFSSKIGQFFGGSPNSVSAGSFATPLSGANVTPRLTSGQGILRPGIFGAPQTGRTALSAFQSPGLQLSAAGGGTPSGGGGGGGPFDFLKNLVGSPGQSQVLPSGGTKTTAPTGLARFGITPQLLGPAALGLGLAAYGQRGGPETPEVPELGQAPAIQQFRSDVTSTLGPLSQRIQSLKTTPLPSEIESPLRRQFDRARKQLYSQFAAFRPGADLATDSEFRQAVEDLNQREAESLYQAQFAFQDQERQNIIAQLGVDETQLGLLGQLANLDIQTIMARTGLQAEEASRFKDIFGNLGAAVAGGGVLNQFGIGQ